MKIYLTIVIPLVVLALVFVGGYFIMPSVEAPQASLDRQIDEQVELAQRMLNQYNAASPNEQQAFEPATQPAGVDSEKWRAYREFDDKTPFASLRERIQGRQRGLQSAAQQIAALGGSQGVPAGVPEAEEAYRRVLDELKGSHALLDKALTTVRNAISLQAGSGEAEVSGRDNLAATRLEAILLRHKADLLRREAALVREKANLDRIRVERLVVTSRDVQDQAAAQKVLLAGGTLQAMAAKPAAVTASPEPASKPAEQNAQPEQAKAAAPKKAGAAGAGNWLTKLTGLVNPKAGKQAAPKPKDEAAAEPAKPEPANPEPAQVAEAQTQPAAEPGPAEQVPSLPERIASLQKNRGEVETRIGQTQAEVQRLEKEIAEQEARRDGARKEAQDAELKMLAAEQKGAKSTDPEAVQTFVNEYRKLAEVQRKAAREAATLEEGSVRNVRSAADPEDILGSPLAAAEEAKPMQSERGLVALRTDKAVAEKTLTASKELLAEIDRQIEQLSGNRKAVESRLAELQATAEKLRGELQKYAESAARQVVQADQLEKEAIDIAENQGKSAAQRAQSAASAFQTKTAQFIRSENPTETPDRKLTEMAADQFTAANVVLLQGDLSYLLARTYVQQAADLKVHEQMLRDLAALSVTIKLNPDQLPEGVTAESVPAAATSADAAAQAATEDLKKAAESAKQALEQYTQAATQLKDLWVVHANMAAVHNLLADLPKVEGDTDDHLALARDTYARAIQGREKRPEYAAYRRILDSLKSVPKEQ